VERDLESQRVVVLEHPAAPVGEHPALRRAAAERADDLLDVEAGLHRQHDPLRHAEVCPGEDDLVHRLDGLAGADRADMSDRRPEGPEDRPGAFDVGRLPADEDRERRLAGALAAAGDRRVDHRDATLEEPFREVAGGAWRDRGAVDHERPWTCTLGSAVGSEEHVRDVRRVGDTDGDDVRFCCSRSRGGGPSDAELVQLRGSASGSVPSGDGEAGSREVGRHRRTHRPEPKERDPLHDDLLLGRSSAGRGRIVAPGQASGERGCPARMNARGRFRAEGDQG
jgi:hypothetical protein